MQLLVVEVATAVPAVFGTAVPVAVTVAEFDAAVPHVVPAEVSPLVVVAANVVAAVSVKDWLSFKIK